MAKTPAPGGHRLHEVHQRSELKHLSRGFTLVELLVVIALLAMAVEER
jgi:prepilin-type N-terminal cleavage/methylation domain-containing protein